jgi:hypothetical protein
MFPDFSASAKEQILSSDKSTSSNFIKKSNKRRSKKSTEKILKETIKFKFMIVLPIITLPFFLALDFQTVRSSLRSLAYLWFGLTILLLIYKYRDDVYHFCQHHITLCSNSNRRSRCRCRCSGSGSDSDSRVSRLRSNQTGRVSRIKKSPVEVRYDILKNKGVIIDGDNELKTTYDSKDKMKKNGKKIKTKVAMDKMTRCIETRGNIHGYYAAIKKYKHLYESDQMEKYGNENEDNQKRYKLNESQFRALVSAVGVARNRLLKEMHLKEVYVTVMKESEVQIHKATVEFQCIMTRDMFNEFNSKK